MFPNLIQICTTTRSSPGFSRPKWCHVTHKLSPPRPKRQSNLFMSLIFLPVCDLRELGWSITETSRSFWRELMPNYVPNTKQARTSISLEPSIHIYCYCENIVSEVNLSQETSNKAPVSSIRSIHGAICRFLKRFYTKSWMGIVSSEI